MCLAEIYLHNKDLLQTYVKLAEEYMSPEEQLIPVLSVGLLSFVHLVLHYKVP